MVTSAPETGIAFCTGCTISLALAAFAERYFSGEAANFFPHPAEQK
jgi:hypothetical protein